MNVQQWAKMSKLGAQAPAAQAQAAAANPMNAIEKLYPKFISPLGADNTLQSQFQVSKTAYDPMSADINALRNSVNNPNIINAQMANLTSQANNARNTINAQGASSLASGMGQLAQTGGLSGGDRSRLASRLGLSQMNANQDINRQMIDGGNNLQIADQQRKDQIMSALPGLSQGYGQSVSGIDQWNKGGAMSAMGSLNQANLGKFSAQMQGLGAQNTSNAIGNSGKGGGLFGGK